MRNIEPHYDEDQYLEEQYGEDDFELKSEESEIIKGKNFANRKSFDKRPKGDFYETPVCMTEELIKTGVLDNVKTIWDCCCGKNAIINVLKKHGFKTFGNDIIYGTDYLKEQYQKHECIVMNPPFSIWDAFVKKAKKEAELVCAIGKITFFGSHKRNVEGIWENLREVYIFDRQIAYDQPLRADNKVTCGMLVSGWFIWDSKYSGLPIIKVIDMQEHIYHKGKK